MKLISILLITCLWSGAAAAEEFNAKVIAVLDGDTLLVQRGAAKIKIRMVNIDAPEKDQAFGMDSRQSLFEMVQKKQVHITSQAVDQYGRVVGLVSVDGKNINEEQVRRGMAWEYTHFHSDRNYLALQSEARQARRGLWAQSSPLAPWQWRKEHPSSLPPTPHKPTATPGATSDAACGQKKHCSQMNSCDEANFYLARCGVNSLDSNKNGMPCEELCAVKKQH